MENKLLEIDWKKIRAQRLSGRYIVQEEVLPLIQNLSKEFQVVVEGYSEEHRPLHSISYGTGAFKVLIWSQMHGNESTTTKAIFDLINFLSEKGEFQQLIKKAFALKIIPMLNPDGALRYSRENAHSIDLNRDALKKTQSEIKTLFRVFENINPDLCLNMHDQRTIFSAGKHNKSAIISFLAPSANENKSITTSRKQAMQLIASMNKNLQKHIPGHIGRYNDDFNPNCVGDTFQSLQVPTILFEAGHFKNDYNREVPREYVFKSLLYLFHTLLFKTENTSTVEEYLALPENEKLFYDIILKNVSLSNQYTDIAIQYEERLVEKQLKFIPKVALTGDLSCYFAHREMDAEFKPILINGRNSLSGSAEIVSLTIDGINILMI